MLERALPKQRLALSRAERGHPRRPPLHWLLLLPALLWVAVVTIAPMAKAVETSLFDTHFLNRGSFIGVGNYVTVLSAPTFTPVLVRTLIYTAISLVVSLGVALGTAMLINQELAGLTVFRVLLMLPWVMSPLLAALMWKIVLNPSIGPGSRLIALVSPSHADVFAHSASAFAALVFVSVWRVYPFGMIVLLGALQTVPTELYEAAGVDGAGAVKKWVYVTIPAIRNSLLVVIVFFSLNFFTMAEVPLVLTGGGPVGSTETLGLRLYREAFTLLDTGIASALAVVLLIINLIFSWLYIRMLRTEDA